MNSKAARKLTLVLAAVPVLAILWVWLSPLAFIPVPWPDDSAFYFVGREFFKWPPRWVMLPQAPFEPSYRIFNFNTMPLYPILVGLGRLLGIDGSFAIKVWPLSALALSGSLLAAWLYRAGLPFTLCLILALAFGMDPGMHWASVLVRPESLVGLCGMAIVLGLTLGFPRRLRERGLWDPVSALLAVAAYSHFNAVHLLFPVVATLAARPRRLVRTGLKTALYLSPWVAIVIWHWDLFVQQMSVQWNRLAVSNDWLNSVPQAVRGIFQDMGSPEPWPEVLHWCGYVFWALMLLAAPFLLLEFWDGAVTPARRWVAAYFALPAEGVAEPAENLAPPVGKRSRNQRAAAAEPGPTAPVPLLPAAAWILGATWLWHSKPEVWFNFFVHISVWCFAGIALLRFWRISQPRLREVRSAAVGSLSAAIAFMAVIFGYVNVTQTARLAATNSWHWDIYRDYIDCIDFRLSELEQNLGHPKPFRVWAPTFPDITVELSRRHPDWELTRTNDFWDRQDLAIEHAHEAEAVVVAETLNWPERTVSSPAYVHPEIVSTWMTWSIHFLNRLWKEPGWKPNRYICQRGRWQAFLFMKDEPPRSMSASR